MNAVLMALNNLSHSFNVSCFAPRPYLSTRNGFAKDSARLRSNFQSVARDLNTTTRNTYGK
jgi:hypothetical protein